MTDEFYKNIIGDFIKKDKSILAVYITIILLIYPLQNIYISNLVSKIYSGVSTKVNSVGIKRHIYALIIVTGIISLLYLLKHKVEMKILPDFTHNIRQKIYEKTLLYNKESYENIELGKYTFHNTYIVLVLKSLLIYFLNTFLRTFIISIIIIGYILYKFPKIGILLLISFIILIIITINDVKAVININNQKNKLYASINENIQESLFNMDNVFLNGQTDEEITKNNELLSKYKEISKKSYDVFNKLYYKYLTILFISFGYIYYSIFKSFSSTNFILLSVLMLLYYNNHIQFITSFFEYSQYLGELKPEKEFFEKFFKTNDNTKQYNNLTFDNVKFKNISFGYGDNKLYQNFSLDINQNEKVLISGKSGRGKTTLIKLLLKLQKLDEGDILISGKSIKNINSDLIRKKIIYVNQKTHLFDNSILNNIKYGNNISDNEIIDLIKKYDVNLDLYANGKSSSLGMQKMAIILRGLLKTDYDMIIFDEPTVSLDGLNKDKIMNMILELTKDKTVIIISHDRDVEKYITKKINL
jgi:ABC-type multidrug transport system fused ATPase/permease subunit